MWTRILPAILAGGVGIAGLAFWSAFSSHRALRHVRWAMAALAVYGAGSFVAAAILGIGLRAALRGEGPIPALPSFLQGGFLGGFVVLPLGWIASMIRIGIPRFRGPAPRPIWFQAVALTTCLALLITSLELRLGDKSLSPQERIALLDKSLHALADGEREMPRDSWDPDYVIRTVGRDPQRLFAWVRDNTYWIPYHGVLRGPVGVLMDRQGNSLDRAILLAVLLQKAGYTVRLAHGDLPPQQAIAILPKLEASRVAAFTSAKPAQDGQPGGRLTKAEYQVDGTTDGAEAQQQVFRRVVAELRSRVADQTDRLLKLAPQPADVWARSFEAAMSAVTDHWWVQGRKGSNWVDLDLVAGRPGVALVAAKETPAIKDLAADLHHTVTIRVIAEQWSGGRLAEHKALEQVLRPSDLYGHSVMLQFWPDEWMQTDASPWQQHSRAAALAQNAWEAVLAVDRYPLSLALLTENGDDPDAPVKGGEFGGLASAFSATMGLSQKNENRHLSAVWIEYEIHVPGEKPRITRRAVFDLLGAEARASGNPQIQLDESKKLTRSLALTMKTEILPLASRLSPQFVAALAGKNLLTDRDLMAFLIKGDLPSGTRNIEQLSSRSEAPLSTLYALALARSELSQKGQVFIDRPNLLTRHLYAAPASDGIALLDATDIVANEVGVSLSVRDPYAARLAQGVLDTNAESLFQPGSNVSMSAGDAFAASRSWLAFVSDHEAGELTKLKLPEDVRRAIRSDLSAGYAVVAPEKVLTDLGDFAGWWRIDRTTGDALGMGANGWGATVPEYTNRASWTTKVRVIVIGKLAAFPLAFALTYGWCLVPLVEKHIEKVGVGSFLAGVQPHAAIATGFRHSLAIWEGAIKPSYGECTADAIFVGGVTAWFAPVGVIEEATPKGQSEPLEPPGGGKGGGKDVGKGPGNPPGGPHEPGSPNEPNPEQNPKPDEPPCDQGGGGANSSQSDNGPPTAPTPDLLVQAQQNYAKANAEYRAALDKYIADMQAYHAYNESRYYTGQNQPGWDPAVNQQLKEAAWNSADAAKAALDKASDAYKELEAQTTAAQPKKSGSGAGGAAGSGAAGACKLPDPPEKIDGLDQALNNNQSGYTQPGLGPGTDPMLDPNGPPTVRDPGNRYQVPGDSNNPFANTQPVDPVTDPNGPPTVRDPQFSDAQSSRGNTQPIPPGQAPPAAPQPNGPSNPNGPADTNGPSQPNGQPPKSWDGKACSWCQQAVPTPGDMSPEDRQKINNAPPPPPRAPGVPFSPKVPGGFAGVGSALSGGPK